MQKPLGPLHCALSFASAPLASWAFRSELCNSSVDLLPPADTRFNECAHRTQPQTVHAVPICFAGWSSFLLPSEGFSGGVAPASALKGCLAPSGNTLWVLAQPGACDKLIGILGWPLACKLTEFRATGSVSHPCGSQLPPPQITAPSSEAHIVLCLRPSYLDQTVPR
jgi:hypothetical protein